MGDEKNGKAKVWIYAVILFTSAFIVLLLTAFSQIKFNKNINEYKNQISDKEIEKSKFQLNLNNALEEIMNLKDDYKKLEEEMSKADTKLEQYKLEIDDISNIKKGSIEAYEYLIASENEKNLGNYINCAEILKNKINIEFLSDNGKEKYLSLVEETFRKAALELYNEGKVLYREKKYTDAIDRFNRSIEFSEDEYFSDDCYYLIAYSYFYLGDQKAVKESVNNIIKKYPESNYVDKVKKLIE